MQWCLGMYASGSTWLFNVVREVTAATIGAPHGVFVAHGVDLDGLDGFRRTLVIKTHDTDKPAETWLAEHAAAIWVTIRDPRDCVTSLMRYHAYTFAEALEAVAESARACARHASDPRAILLRYESGFIDNVVTLDVIGTAFHAPMPRGARARIFRNSRRKAIEAFIARLPDLPSAIMVEEDHRLDLVTQWHDHHANRDGEVGRWRSMLSADQVRAVEAELGAWMDRFAYRRAEAPDESKPLAAEAAKSSPDDAKTALRRAASRVPGTGPLIVVAVSDEDHLFLENWLRHMRRLGISRILVVATDDALVRRLRDSDLTIARAGFDGDARLRRIRVWAALSEAGFDIIQTDIDAIWLQDPIPAFLSDPRFDLVFSQGMLHPGALAEQWGFVLCTGLFAARAGDAADAFFAAITARAEQMAVTDDQDAINRVLAEHGVDWDKASQTTKALDLGGGDRMTVDAETLVGTCASLGLRIGVLPHRRFPRRFGAEPAAIVHRVPRAQGSGSRIESLRAAGCWLADQTG